MRPLPEALSVAWRSLCSFCHNFAKKEDGVTTLEWLVIGGVAIIMGVTMTWLATSNFGAAGSYIEGKVNAASSQ